LRDELVSEQLHRHVFIKRPRRLATWEQIRLVRAQPSVLTTGAEDVPKTVLGALGEATLQDHLYRPLIDALANHKYAPKTLAQLAADPRLKSFEFSQIASAALVLAGAGFVHPAQPVTQKARSYCKALNRNICERARGSQDINVLASPVTGGGVAAARFQQLFLLAIAHGKNSPADQAAFVWDVLVTQGQRVIKEGKTLETAEDNLAELKTQATTFMERRFPLLKALEVA